MTTGTLPPATAAALQSPARPRAGFVGLILGCGILLVLAVAAVWAARQQLEEVFADLDNASLHQAEDTMDALLDQQRARLLASVQILSEDTRIRSTAMTTGFDEGTIRDVLEDLKKASSANVLAVLDERGKVRAITGIEGLRDMDLSGSPVIKAALEHPSSNFWALPDQVLIIGVAPIRAGPRVSALLLMGLSLGRQQMSTIQRVTGVAGAIFVGDRAIAGSSDDPGVVEVLRAANTAGGIDGRVIPGQPNFLVRVTRTNDSATAAKLVWAVPRHRQTPQAGMVRMATWLAALFATLAFALVVLMTRKRNGGP